MAIDPTFLAKLRTPGTLLPVREARPDEIGAVNARIQAGGVHNRGGRLLEHALTAALVCEAEAVLFPVDDGIPILLREEGIPVA